MTKEKMSGMSITISDDDRALVNELQKKLGLDRKPLFMLLVREKLIELENRGT